MELYIVTEMEDGWAFVTSLSTWTEEDLVPCGAGDIPHSIGQGDVIAFSGIEEAGQSAQAFCGEHALADPVEVESYSIHSFLDSALHVRDTFNEEHAS
jgi:hypothetical protein